MHVKRRPEHLFAKKQGAVLCFMHAPTVRTAVMQTSLVFSPAAHRAALGATKKAVTIKIMKMLTNEKTRR